MTSNYKIDTEYWARLYKPRNSNPDLTFIIKYNYDGALYTNVSGRDMVAPVQGSRYGTIKHQNTLLLSGSAFETVVKLNPERYRRISEEMYIRALISGKIDD